MVDRPIQKAIEEGIDTATEQTKNLCPWLESPYLCPTCSVYCDAERSYVQSQAMVMKVWRCPSCEQRFYRNRD